MLTFGARAPLESVTVPTMVAVVWPQTAAHAVTISNTSTLLISRMVLLKSSREQNTMHSTVCPTRRGPEWARMNGSGRVEGDASWRRGAAGREFRGGTARRGWVV